MTMWMRIIGQFFQYNTSNIQIVENKNPKSTLCIKKKLSSQQGTKDISVELFYTEKVDEMLGGGWAQGECASERRGVTER